MLVTLLMVFGSKNKKEKEHDTAVPVFCQTAPIACRKYTFSMKFSLDMHLNQHWQMSQTKICQRSLSQIADFNGTLSSLHNASAEKQPWASNYVEDSAGVRHWALLWAEGKGYFFSPLHLHTVGTKSTNGQGQVQTASLHGACHRSWIQQSIWVPYSLLQYE